MKKRIDKISGYFKVEKLKNDKRIVVFLVCVLIATVLWFLNAMSKDYSTTISYPVKYISAPKNQFLANEPASKLELKVQAHGFTLLRHKLSLSFSPITLNLTNITKNISPSADGYNIKTNSLLRRVSDQVSNEISINEILPENIIVRLDSLKSKTIPVRANVKVEFKDQFELKEPIFTIPNKIEITGPAAILDTIYFLQTEEKSYQKMDADIVKMLDVIHPEKTKINPEKISLNILVEKFTEKEIKVPIQVKNAPSDSQIKLFPSDVKLTVLIGLSKFESIDASDFKIVVDFAEINPETENLEVKIETKPFFVEIRRYSPESVEFLIETN